MSKDPATLWYWNDWITGTMTFSRHLKGCYMDLLGAQFNAGHLSLDEIKTVLGSDFGATWPTLQKKFEKDSNGLFFNKKAEETLQKRRAFTKSRKDNLNSSGAMGDHMETTNGIEIRKLNFKQEIGSFKENFSEKILSEFYSYWTEANPRGKMRFELEKVFEVSKRLATWQKNEDKFNIGKSNNGTSAKGW